MGCHYAKKEDTHTLARRDVYPAIYPRTDAGGVVVIDFF